MFFNPKIVKMTASEVMTRLPREIVCSGNATRTDNIYQVPLDPAYVMKKIKSWKYDYIPERRDCDAFVDIFRGLIAQKGYGNLLAMVADLTLKNHQGHCLIAFIDLTKERSLLFGEPQTGQMVNCDHLDIKLRL